jgi:hypothetical protein
MREWAAQLMFPASDEGVIDVARTLTSLRLLAGEDHVLGVCALMKDPAAEYVWSVPVLGRAALEAFGQVRHLTEMRISMRLRAGRVMNELIDSAQNIRRLPEEARSDSPPQDLRDGQAEAMGLTRVLNRKGKPTEWFEERRPTNTELVARLFDDGDIGAAIYNFWSGVAHASSWGLAQTLGEAEDHPSGFGHQAPIVSSTRTLTTTSLLLVLAHLEAMEHYMGWNGWPAPRYQAALECHRQLLDGFVKSEMPDDDSDRRPQASLFLWTPP